MGEPNLNQYRGYLRALAQIELGHRLQGKVDPSDIVQQSLLEAHQDLAALKGKTEGELVAWLRTILTRNLLNTAREFAAQKRDICRERSLAQRVEDSSVRLEKFLASDQTSPSQRVIRGEQLQVEISPQGIIRMGPEAKQTRVLVDFDQIVPAINLP